MLYAILTRTWLWLYWFVEYHSLHEWEYGSPLKEVDCEMLIDHLASILKIESLEYDYWKYENI